jgi:L-asparaginase/Glu-tRNA(Gln) amidotransferase subunit D
MAAAIREAMHNDRIVGVVVTHGTDTLHYTAAALSYLIPEASKAVILAGSNLGWNVEGTDARRNLADAILAANIRQLKGVFVVCNRTVYAGIRLRKSASPERGEADIFEPVNYPLVGVLNCHSWGFGHRFDPLINPVYVDTAVLRGGDLRTFSSDISVELVWVHPAMSPDTIPGPGTVSAIVLAAYGSGGAPIGRHTGPDHDPILTKLEAFLKSGGIILVTSQARMPIVRMESYAAYEGLHVLAAKYQRVVFCHDLSPEEALVVLLIGLNSGLDARGLERAVDALAKSLPSVDSMRSSYWYLLSRTRRAFRRLTASYELGAVLFPWYDKVKEGCDINENFDHALAESILVDAGESRGFEYPFNRWAGADNPFVRVKPGVSVEDAINAVREKDEAAGRALDELKQCVLSSHEIRSAWPEAHSIALFQIRALANQMDHVLDLLTKPGGLS